MSTDEKPLHVRVAEALGWEWGTFAGVSILMPPGRFEQEAFPGSSWERGCMGKIEPPEQAFYDSALGYQQFPAIPRYDTDWAATGPLVEKYEIRLRPVAPGGITSHWVAKAKDRGEHGESRMPLIAVCNLILALHAAGKLKEAV